MSLTLGTGPLAARRRGTFNFDIAAASPAHTIYVEDVPQRIRAVWRGQTVLDTRRAKILFESNILGQWYVPAEDVRTDLLTPTDTSTHCPFKGDASYWTLTVDGESLPDVVWSYADPIPGVEAVRGMQAFYFDRMDAWFEEDEQVFGHARDPYHRVDALRTSDRVTVTVDGTVVARSERTIKVLETSLPPRWYLPTDDVLVPLESSDTTSVCAYKGTASYRSVAGVKDSVWLYGEPLPAAGAIAGLVSFWGDGVEVSVEPGP